MTWTTVQTISVIANQWVSTSPVAGHYFRLKHTYSGLPEWYFKGRIAQLQLGSDNSKEIYDIRNLSAKPEVEIYDFKGFAELTNRRIGIRGPTGEIPPVPWSWAIKIEVSDFLEVEGGESGGMIANLQLISTDLTIQSGVNALLVGKVITADGVSIVVELGAELVII